MDNNDSILQKKIEFIKGNKIKNNIAKFYTALLDYYNNVVRRPQFAISITVLTIITYGYSIFNRSIGIDDLTDDLYVGEHRMIASRRWAMELISKLYYKNGFVPEIDKLISILFLVLAVIILGAIIYDLFHEKYTLWEYTIFSLVFISYPLFTEIYQYGGGFSVTLELIIGASVILYVTASDDKTLVEYILLGLLMSLIMAGYESVAFAYLTTVFIVLFIKSLNKKFNEYNWILDGMKYACPLILGFVFKFIIGNVLLIVFDLNKSNQGDIGLIWGRDSLVITIKSLIMHIFERYLLRGLIYMPIGLLVFCQIIFLVVVMYYYIRNKSIGTLVLGIFTLISVYALCIIKGEAMPYRTAAAPWVFTAFSSILFMHLFEGKCKIIISLFFLIIAIRQSIFTNSILAANVQRSDYELNILNQLGMKLETQYDLSKEIVFAGDFELGEQLESYVRAKDNVLSKLYERIMLKHGKEPHLRYVETSFNSVIRWAQQAFGSQERMRLLFRYEGYDIKVKNIKAWEELDDYTQMAIRNSMTKYDIKDMGDYILVYLGK